ncbi:hypothetical protein [Rhodovulum sulfidophilum]|uniref:hypothetical protein n=1 Tax=Rhodovulum sulfidophilum TaxID=35806 RepID=UPI000951BA83|nr:hypothetical protein [Rhodovulum sulfidophilum]MBL3554045.1 hypothetical protein [Rhodovulum sulfidophilum]OLS47690.1 hypothetical protein BV379_04890 [Rhodovulum sulfidophilum]
MYDKSDPRAALASTPADSMIGVTGLVAEEQVATFYDSPPQLDDDTGQTWLYRGHNFLVALSHAASGASFDRVAQADEYCVLLPKGGATIEWNGAVTEVPGHSIAFVPAGDSRVTAEGGEIVRLFTTANEDLLALCGNAGGYDRPRSHVKPLTAWPAPKGGFKVRHYSLDVAPEPGRFGRIFRCTTLMVNVLEPFEGPRDPSKMSPHHHDDFEQGSLALSGEFTHYLRWSWTSDMADWKDDKVLKMAAPSLLVIPPPVIHTTRATGPGDNLLADIFSPPREDFSLKPGWVLNAEDYPMPEQA